MYVKFVRETFKFTRFRLVDWAVNSVNSFTTCQHPSDTGATPIDVDQNISPYPAALFLFELPSKCHHLICS